ncbi:MAG: hypothetical protein GX359_11120 [Clostridiales bacterium]|nr:hypothetical protein [Clostridiales bacterium]
MANYLVTKIQGGEPPSFLSLPVQLTVRDSVRPLIGHTKEERKMEQIK